MEVLKVDQAQKRYDSFALRCSLQVEAGHITGLIGKNGAGKTTLFKSILGLIAIDGGTITLWGKDIRQIQAKDRNALGVVLPDTGMSEYLTISQIIPILQNIYAVFDRDFFIHQAHHFQLPMDKKIKDFSTGMKAKLKVLIAMSHQAQLLILDEPTAGLDVMAREEILDLLRMFMENQEQGAILMSSHISNDLEHLCDDIYLIDEGQILLHEDTDVLLDEYAILKVNEAQYQQLDTSYLLRVKKEDYGFQCLTNEKQYYVENAPEVVMEKASIDKILVLMTKGEKI